MRALLAALLLLAPQDSGEMLKWIDGRADHYGALSAKIWEFAEVGYKEVKSAGLLKDDLKAAGFRIEENRMRSAARP